MTAAEKKKAIWLGGIVGVLGLYSIYTNFLSEPSTSSSSHAATSVGKTATDGAMTMGSPTAKNAPRPRANSRSRSDDFNPAYLANRPEDRPDPTKVDPTLRLDYFAKVQEVDAAGGKRNLFAFGQPPPPPAPKVDLTKQAEPKVRLDEIAAATAAAREAAKAKAADPPLNTGLKYYGIVALSSGGEKTACLLNKDEILLATEGDTLERRYMVTKIGPTSLTVRDTETKKEETIQIMQETKERGSL